MIKQVYFKKKSNNEYLYSSVNLRLQLKQPFMLKISPLMEVLYFKEKLDEEFNKHKKIMIQQGPCLADYRVVSRWLPLVCVSQKFKDVFEPYLKGYWYPTDQEGYYIFLLDRCLDVLDEKTIIINETQAPYMYTCMENVAFKPETEQEFLFTVPQEPFIQLATVQFEQLYRQNNMTGIQFYKDINFKKRDQSEDIFRFKQYDDEGNCLNP